MAKNAVDRIFPYRKDDDVLHSVSLKSGRVQLELITDVNADKISRRRSYVNLAAEGVGGVKFVSLTSTQDVDDLIVALTFFKQEMEADN